MLFALRDAVGDTNNKKKSPILFFFTILFIIVIVMFVANRRSTLVEEVYLPFYHWLPDELAFKYSRFSPRDNFRDLYRQCDEEFMLSFLRRGRGISFHEFELAMKPLAQMNIVSSMFMHWRKRSILYRLACIFTTDYRYESFLAKLCPNIHRGFFHSTLYLIIRKD